MRSSRFATALLVLARLAVATAAGAVGPLDGSYQVSVPIPGYDPLTWYIVVLQNDAQSPNFGFALLEPEFGIWLYGFGQLSAQNHTTGPIIDPFDHSEIGQFNLQFGNGSVNGTITLPMFLIDDPVSVSGIRFF
jgi:hypothetical protein